MYLFIGTVCALAHFHCINDAGVCFQNLARDKALTLTSSQLNINILYLCVQTKV